MSLLRDRDREISAELANMHVVLLAGTCQRARASEVSERVLGNHRMWTFGYPNSKDANKSAGVPIMLHRQYFDPNKIHKVYISETSFPRCLRDMGFTEDERWLLRGRVGGLRYRDGLFDLTLTTTYFPPKPKTTAERPQYERIC